MQINQAAKPSGCLFSMTNNRMFYVCADQVDFLLVSIPDTDRFGVIALEKQMARYMKATNLLVAYTFPSLTKDPAGCPGWEKASFHSSSGTDLSAFYGNSDEQSV